MRVPPATPPPGKIRENPAWPDVHHPSNGRAWISRFSSNLMNYFQILLVSCSPVRDYETILAVSVNTNSLSVAIEQFFSAGVDIGNTYAALKNRHRRPATPIFSISPQPWARPGTNGRAWISSVFLKLYDIFSDFAHPVQPRARL